MARKKITSLLGSDPIYSKQFGDTPKSEPSPKMVEPERPEKATDTAKPTKTQVANPKPKQKSPAPIKAAAPPAKGQTRAVHVRAAPTTDHAAGLARLEAAGLPSSDVVRLAGKRAVKKFELKSKYVKPQDVDRLPSTMSFRTMKTLSAQTLDKLRDQADPLRLRSDAAVIQGQLEPVFWDELTAVIKELRKQYG